MHCRDVPAGSLQCIRHLKHGEFSGPIARFPPSVGIEYQVARRAKHDSRLVALHFGATGCSLLRTPKTVRHGVTVKVVLCVPPNFAEMVTDFVAVTGLVAIANVADNILAGTVTDEGTVATVVLLLVKLTVAPSGGAGPLKVTVPIACVPPWTEVGLKVSELSPAALTVKLAVFAVVP